MIEYNGPVAPRAKLVYGDPYGHEYSVTFYSSLNGCSLLKFENVSQICTMEFNMSGLQELIDNLELQKVDLQNHLNNRDGY